MKMVLNQNFLNKSLNRFQTKIVLSSARLFILTALGGCLSFLPTALVHAQIINLNSGEVMTCQSVNNTTVPNNRVYICVLANNEYLTPGGTMNAIVPGQNASNYTMTLAQIDALSPAGLQIPNINAGGRMWFSYYQPMNMPIVAGPGVVQPNIGNPSDPNINTVFDWMEFAEGSDWIYCNTTQVNMFGISYTMGLYNVGGGLNGASGIPDCYSDIVAKYEAYMNAIPGASLFNSLVGPVRIVAPADGTFAAGGANGTYFNNYISQLWTEYQFTPLVISTGGNTYYGTTTGPGSQMTFTGPGGPYYVGYPNTQDALAASGVFASGNPMELAIEVVMAAGINRHVLDNVANLNNPAAFYQTAPCNYYAAFWHSVNLNRLAYGFPYDDDDNQSDLLVSTNARALAVTFSGCVPTLTSTFMASPTPTRTSSSTATFTVSNTVTHTSTNTVTMTDTTTTTNSATTTSTNTATNTVTSTFTPTNTATRTSTCSATNTATLTDTTTATNSATTTSTNTATNTSTNTLSPTGTSTPTGTATNTCINTATSTATFTATHTATITFTNTLVSTATNTSTTTSTRSATSSATQTSTNTPTVTSTVTSLRTPAPTITPSPTGTSTSSPTASYRNTATVTPVNTWTPTPTVSADIFQICRNVFNETVDGTVCVSFSSAQYPGQMTLKIYNSVGEHIKTLFDESLTQPLPPTIINWDGTNKFGQKVASGVYVVYLIKPLGRSTGRLVVIR